MMVQFNFLRNRVIKWSHCFATVPGCDPPPVCKPICPPAKNGKDSKTDRLLRQEPGDVRCGFIPNEWFELFFKRTGVSGFGTFCFTVGITLMSKEYYILEHEYYNGLSMLLMCVMASKKIGPGIAKFLDSEIDEYERSLTGHRKETTELYENAIQHEKKLQHSSEGFLMLAAAKRENVDLQREAAYRARCMFAYQETVKRLEYCATRDIVEQAIAKRCMADWVVEQVRNAVTQEIQQKSVNKCIEDLKYLADTYGTLSAPYPSEDIDSLYEDTEKPTNGKK
ncbi:ATP synthase subunit b, mitochondrial-like [Photinus pyralis]|uniref:ATP synthase subunit b, mitochondrial-like n=1 Tax=Photinus pyralis TaxID=7054 RepID=UPI001267641B|nr:ATP synthase subunit b, mitochondrial-like [Photinus pyralis]